MKYSTYCNIIKSPCNNNFSVEQHFFNAENGAQFKMMSTQTIMR